MNIKTENGGRSNEDDNKQTKTTGEQKIVTTKISKDKNIIKKSPYELLRESNIARNQERLAELGLLKPSSSSRGKARTTINEKKQLSTSSTVLLLPPVRRSQRKRGRSTQSIADEEVFTDEEEKDSSSVTDLTNDARRKAKHREINNAPNIISRHKKSPTRGNLADSTHCGQTSSFSSTLTKHNPKSKAKNITTRMVDVDVDRILSHYLGRSMEETGKAVVVYSCVELSSSSSSILSTSPSSSVSFNKLSGVLEWKNAMFLWVNLIRDNQEGEQINDFLEDGRKMTWFGGSRMHDDTPVIQRLIHEGKREQTASSTMRSPVSQQEADRSKEKPQYVTGSMNSPILLWCRFFDEKKKAQPYICLGRLGYDSHIPQSRPMRFIWNLLDCKELMGSSSSTADEARGLLPYEKKLNLR